jgi:hypothetical protein
VQAYVTYNVFYEAVSHRMTATLNGHAETMSEPYSGNTGYQWGYMVQPIPLSDLVNGANSFRLASADSCSGNNCPAIANIDLELVRKATPVSPAAVNAVSSSTTTATGSLIVTFVARGDNGSPIIRFNVGCTSKNGGVTVLGVLMGAVAGPTTLAGVTTGKTYTCTVSATNRVGTSAASDRSHVVTVGAPAKPTRPIATKTASGVVRVSFSAPNDNGAPITGYVAICSSGNGGLKGMQIGVAGPLTVRGLTPGKSYACTAWASNSRGLGAPSPPSVELNA